MNDIDLIQNIIKAKQKLIISIVKNDTGINCLLELFNLLESGEINLSQLFKNHKSIETDKLSIEIEQIIKLMLEIDTLSNKLNTIELEPQENKKIRRSINKKKKYIGKIIRNYEITDVCINTTIEFIEQYFKPYQQLLERKKEYKRESKKTDEFSEYYTKKYNKLKKIVEDIDIENKNIFRNLYRSYYKIKSSLNEVKFAKNELIKFYLLTTTKIATEYLNKGLELDDLEGEGNIGLLICLEEFVFYNNTNFDSYCQWSIREEILKSLFSHMNLFYRSDNLLQMSETDIMNFHQIIESARNYVISKGKEPNTTIISGLTNIPIKTVTNYLTGNFETFYSEKVPEEEITSLEIIKHIDVVPDRLSKKPKKKPKTSPVKKLSVDELENKASAFKLNATDKKQAKTRIKIKESLFRKIVASKSKKRRNPFLLEIAKRKANGFCRLCGAGAPFKDKNGYPFLETHHIKWLSKGGEDSLENMAAVCPNCHRRLHILNLQSDVDKLRAKVNVH